MKDYELYAKAKALLDAGSLEQFELDYQEAESIYFEMRAEMANECAMFGDSGPGSMVRAKAYREGLAEEKAVIAAAYALA